MTQTRRIILNVAATYGRSLLSLVCGLATGRWVLEALGTQRYGVFGVVGVILGLVGVINQVLASSVGRYFAFAVGKAMSSQDKSSAVNESCGWFNTALIIHVLMAVVLVALGYPLGFWAIRCYFNIPPEMVEGSLWAFTFSMVTTFFSIATVPFRSLYGAHQYIAEMTIYGVAATIANVVFAWILLSYQGDRLWFNAFYMMLVATIPNIAIAIRSFWVFPECRVVPSMMFNKSRFRQLFSFAGWQIVAWLGLTMRFQGLTTLCNKVLGLEYNASLSVASTVSQHTMTFGHTVNGAFAPAITNAAGAENRPLFNVLVLQTCKFGTIMSAVFIIPLCLEMHYVIHLWLTTVPPMVEMLCIVSLMTQIVERLTFGFANAVTAYGNIKWMEILSGVIWCICFGLGCLFLLVFDMGIVGIPLAVLIAQTMNSILRFCLAKWQIHMKMRKWFSSFIMPFSIVSVISLGTGLLIRFLMAESFARFALVCVVSATIFMIGSIFFICDAEERAYMKKQLRNRLPWLKKGE